MAAAKFSQHTRDLYNKKLEGKDIETKIAWLEIAERQKYNYYCDMCNNNWNWTNEQVREYEASWNEIIEMLNELKEEQKNAKENSVV